AAQISAQTVSEFADLVGPESGPVLVIGDHDGRLKVAELLHALQCRLVLREVVNFVFEPLAVKSTIGRRALNARRFRVHRNRHDLKTFPHKICISPANPRRASNTTYSSAFCGEPQGLVVTPL